MIRNTIHIPERVVSDSTAPHGVSAILHIGAGSCRELDYYLSLNPQRVILVEANPDEVRKLNRRASQFPQVEVVCAAVSGSVGPQSLRLFNMPHWNSLRPPTGLIGKFPGLRQLKEVAVEPVLPGELVASIGIDAGGRNWLIVDAPGEEAGILGGLQAELFQRVILHCPEETLYEAASRADALLDLLARAGYDIDSEDRSVPEVPCWTLIRNPLKVEIAELRRTLKHLEEKLGEKQDAYARDLASMRELVDRNARLAAERASALDALTAERVRISGMLEASSTRILQLEEQQRCLLKTLGEDVKALTQIMRAEPSMVSELQRFSAETMRLVQKILEDHSGRTDKAIRAVKRQLSAEMALSSRRMMSRLSLENYLNGGTLHPSTQQWAVSGELALYLVQLIERNHYDHIIEFGSGTSTVIMASALLRNISKYESAPRLTSFEHHREYFEKTESDLRQAGLREIVDLEHVPLIEHSTPAGESFLYYGCDRKIEAIAAQLKSGTGARLLVLVDGPPGNIGKEARYPALPILAQYLGGHRMDIVIDDYLRPDERAIVGRWTELLDRREMSWATTELDFEKGACLLEIG